MFGTATIVIGSFFALILIFKSARVVPQRSELVIERIIYSINGDTLSFERPLDKTLLNREYYDNGQIKLEENYKDGKKDGQSIWFEKDGKFNRKENYVNGNLIKSTVYGTPYSSEYYFDDGILVNHIFYEDGKISSQGNYTGGYYNYDNGEYQYGKEHGEWIFYYPDKRVEKSYNNGRLDSSIITYYLNNQIKEIKEYNTGCTYYSHYVPQNGKYITYYHYLYSSFG